MALGLGFDSEVAKMEARGNCFWNSQDVSILLGLCLQSYNLEQNLIQQSLKIMI